MEKRSKYRCLNLAVECDLVKFGHDDTLTSDLNIDEQRKEVHALLNQFSILTNKHQTIIKIQKLCFITLKRECIAFINCIWLFVVCCTLIYNKKGPFSFLSPN